MPSPYDCCRKCPDRRAWPPTRPACHADCPRYAAAVAEAQELRARRDKEKVLDSYTGRSKAQHSACVMREAKRRRERARR